MKKESNAEIKTASTMGSTDVTRAAGAAAMTEHKRLGRGLAALIGDVGDDAAPADSGRKPRRAPIESLRRNPRNPRRDFTDAELDELASSIRERGIIQPIVVRAVAGETDGFEIIAGERRWRAAQRAGLHEVPVAVIDASDAQSLEFAVIENVQRADLNPMEEAAGYLALMDDFNRTQDEVAKIVGKSRPHVTNTVRLLKLPEPVKALVRAGKLSAGHARLLVGHVNAQVLAEMAIEEGYSVRQLEEWVREEPGKPGDTTFDATQKKSRAANLKDADTRALEKRLSTSLGLDVSIDHRGKGGTLHIKYRDLDQLDEVLKKLDRK
jgi:ParB family transcriptional regulator, chromosome partitioning protein